MLDKKRILEVMISYGKQIGYPDQIGPKQFIEKHLNECFKVLLMKKLVKPEHYEAFRKVAIVKYQEWWLLNR